jgi:hypothetical protein
VAAADTARLVAELSLADKFSPAMKGVIGSLDKAESRFGAIGKKAQQGVANFTRNVGLIGVGVAGALATQVVAGIHSLEDLQTQLNATEGVIKSTGGAAGVTAKQVRDLATSLEETTTVDDKAIQAGENLLLTFTNIGSKVFPQATKATLDLAIAMNNGQAEGADLSASAIQIGKALNDPIKGVTALTKVGVSFTKQQKDQIKTLVESGKTVEAQTIILNELEKEFGQAGVAAGTGFGADMRRVGDAVEGAQQALAKGFLPVITKVAAVLNKKLNDPAVLANIGKLGDKLANSLDSLISAASRLPWGAIGDSLQIAGSGAEAILNAFVSLPPWVQTAVLTGWGLNKLTGGALGGIVGELGKGLIKGVLGINAAQVNIKAATVSGVGGGVPTTAGGATSKIGSVASAVGKVFIVGAAAGAFLELAQVLGAQSTANKGLEDALATQTQKFTGGASLNELQKSLAGVDARIHDLEYSLTPEAIAYQLNIDGVRDSVEKSRADLVAAIEAQGGSTDPAVLATITGTTNAVKDSAKLQTVTNERLEAIRGFTQESADATKTAKASVVAATQAAAAAQVHTTERAEQNVADKINQLNAQARTAAQLAAGDSRSEQAAVARAATQTAAATVAAGGKAAAAGNVVATAVRNKDLSVNISNKLYLSQRISVTNDLNAKNNFKSVYSVAF